jgi:hypothetical protein
MARAEKDEIIVKNIPLNEFIDSFDLPPIRFYGFKEFINNKYLYETGIRHPGDSFFKLNKEIPDWAQIIHGNAFNADQSIILQIGRLGLIHWYCLIISKLLEYISNNNTIIKNTATFKTQYISAMYKRLLDAKLSETESIPLGFGQFDDRERNPDIKSMIIENEIAQVTQFRKFYEESNYDNELFKNIYGKATSNELIDKHVVAFLRLKNILEKFYNLLQHDKSKELTTTNNQLGKLCDLIHYNLFTLIYRSYIDYKILPNMYTTRFDNYSSIEPRPEIKLKVVNFIQVLDFLQNPVQCDIADIKLDIVETAEEITYTMKCDDTKAKQKYLKYKQKYLKLRNTLFNIE